MHIFTQYNIIRTTQYCIYYTAQCTLRSIYHIAYTTRYNYTVLYILHSTVYTTQHIRTMYIGKQHILHNGYYTVYTTQHHKNTYLKLPNQQKCCTGHSSFRVALF